MSKKYCILFLSAIITMISCSHLQKQGNESKILASAYGNHLYEKDVEPQLSEWHSSLDSQKIISLYIDNWIMDQILHAEARKNINKERISKLVRDYETSLYIHQLEEDYIKKELNTFVDSSEISDYFEENQDAFIPKNDVIRYFMIKIPKDCDNDTLKTLWDTEDLPVLKEFIYDCDGTMILDPFNWYDKIDLKDIIPYELFSKINFNKTESYSLEEDDKKYYVKILETVKESEIPPVSYYSEKIKEIILRSRSESLIKELKNKIFKEKIKSKSIKIYSTNLD